MATISQPFLTECHQRLVAFSPNFWLDSALASNLPADFALVLGTFTWTDGGTFPCVSSSGLSDI
jgi:hypothetical protein